MEQVPGEKLTYRIAYVSKEKNLRNTTTLVVEKFSGMVEGEKAYGYEWVFEKEMRGYKVKVEYYSLYAESGKSCTMEKASYMGQTMVLMPWTCQSAGESSESLRSKSGPSGMINVNLETGMKIVPAGTFYCLIYRSHSSEGGTSTVWYSPEVPLTHIVASEYEDSKVRIYMELCR